jgi:hypothetical protein
MSGISEKLAVTMLRQRKQEELNTLLLLELGSNFGIDYARESAVFSNRPYRTKGIQRHHGQGVKTSKTASIKRRDIRARWKANEYPRDTRNGTAKGKRRAVPATIIAQVDPEQPKVEDPITPEGQILQCTKMGAEQQLDALKVVCTAMELENHSESDKEIKVAQLEGPFKSIPGSMSESSVSKARQAAFNARLTHRFVN